MKNIFKKHNERKEQKANIHYNVNSKIYYNEFLPPNIPTYKAKIDLFDPTKHSYPIGGIKLEVEEETTIDRLIHLLNKEFKIAVHNEKHDVVFYDYNYFEGENDNDFIFRIPKSEYLNFSRALVKAIGNAEEKDKDKIIMLAYQLYNKEALEKSKEEHTNEQHP